MQQTGIYEQLVTQLVADRLNHEQFFVGERPLEAAEAAHFLSTFLSKVIHYAINSVPSGDKRISQQIDLANKLVTWLEEHIRDDSLIDGNLIDSQGRILTALFEKQNPIAVDLEEYRKSIFPLTGLSQSELFSGANAGISLETELKREILSSDEIFWLVSFIKWAGIRIFKKELEDFTRRGNKLSIITTSYMGATDIKAVEFLTNLPNTEVKLSYNTEQERLHAKSYIFKRNTGFDTAYIGSSNLSRSALTNGLEWNLKITSQEIPHIIKKTLSTFETYWQSPEFETFTGDKSSQEKLGKALRSEKGRDQDNFEFHFDIKPYTHQTEILQKLATEREVHHRFRNLVVAATGTGKTIISAFDFANFYRSHPDAKFLFIAHRVEILQQARAAYRGVLKNNTFGELWVGQHKPIHYHQLFASIQTMNNQLENLSLDADYYDYIVIDEVHHVTASSYRGLLDHFKPKILLGLTATPERQDGGSILPDFDNVIAAEIRLPEAINQRHLCPFQYFGIDDGTDLSSVNWQRGRYEVAELTRIYTRNDQRALRIMQSLNDIVTDVKKIKALAFCVSQDHAIFMAKKFNLKGISADVLTSKNSQHRNEKREALRQGKIQILCVVDIFNEGVDIPEVDTLLFLRPTESLTLFLQQLGRGLRLSDSNKECCTVLDFVGNARPEYDFANKFRALTGKSQTPISNEIKDGFPNLPLGCRIELEESTQSIILRNIKSAINNKQRLQQLIRRFSEQTKVTLSLNSFLSIHPEVSLSDLYKPSDGKLGGWNWLVNSDISSTETKIYEAYYRAINTQLLVCNSISYFKFLLDLCGRNFTYRKTDDSYAFALMTHYTFWDKAGPDNKFKSIEQSLTALKHPLLQKELRDVISNRIETIQHQEQDIHTNTKHAIKLHSRYTREQILAAFGGSKFEKKSTSREGVVDLKDKNIELLFVTLNKNEKNYSPTTLYNDYAVSPIRFHWQSQNSARPDRGKGKSYIQHEKEGKAILLFVREQNKDEHKRTMGFVNFGEVKYVSHKGMRPMDITWQLNKPMPSEMWHQTAKLAIN